MEREHLVKFIEGEVKGFEIHTITHRGTGLAHGFSGKTQIRKEQGRTAGA